MEQEENWMHKIRSLAPLIEKIEIEVVTCEAKVKKLQATLKLQALAQGIKTTSAQETYADSQESLYEARLKIGVAKGGLSALKINLKALEIGFEQWRTEQVSARKEQARYGA
jgi:hypothetical protein|tara:strand:+ start:794 stop:1129 length:336 start_codon:yes stop_codon:yes gene_type:complete